MEKRNWKRILAALLTCAMVLSTGCLPVLAEDPANSPCEVPVSDSHGEVDVGGVYDEELSKTPVLEADLVVEDESDPALYIHDCDGDTSSFTVTGSVSETNTGNHHASATAVVAATDDEGTVNVTVNGNVTATATATAEHGGYAKATAIDVEADYGATANINVGGKVTADIGETRHGSEKAIVADAEYESTIDITVGKGAEGQVDIDSSYGSSNTVTIKDGGITATGLHDCEKAVEIDNDYSTALVDITGGIKTDGVAIDSETTSYCDETEASTTIKVTGNIASEVASDEEDPSDAKAVEVDSYGQSAVTTVDLNGNVIATGDNATAVDLDTYSGGTITATIVGDVTATGSENGETATGLDLTNGRAVQEIEIVGNVKATGTEESNGIVLDASARVEYSVDVSELNPEELIEKAIPYPVGEEENPYTFLGTIKLINDAEEGEYAQGYLFSKGTGDSKEYFLMESRRRFSIKPEVTEWNVDSPLGPTQVDVVPFEVEVLSSNGKEPTIGEVYANGENPFYLIPLSDVKMEVLEESTTNLNITGNVTADNYGVKVDATPGATADIVIDGTVSGGKGGIVLVNNTELGSGVTMTVWAVTPDENGGVVFTENSGKSSCPSYAYYNDPRGMTRCSGEDAEETKPTLARNTEAEAQLQYIIRVRDDSKDYIATTGTTEYLAANGKTYNVAHEGDTVTMKLNIPQGYEITGAYGDVDQKTQLLKDADGNYYLKVPRGGAVELSITLSKIPEEKKEEKKEEPEKPVDPEVPGEPAIAPIVFDLNTGNPGDNITIMPHVGDVITLKETPVRDGYTFLYWKGSDVSPKSPYWKEPDPKTDFQYKAGASFNVKENYYFVAVWQKN